MFLKFVVECYTVKPRPWWLATLEYLDAKPQISALESNGVTSKY